MSSHICTILALFWRLLVHISGNWSPNTRKDLAVLIRICHEEVPTLHDLSSIVHHIFVGVSALLKCSSLSAMVIEPCKESMKFDYDLFLIEIQANVNWRSWAWFFFLNDYLFLLLLNQLLSSDWMNDHQWSWFEKEITAINPNIRIKILLSLYLLSSLSMVQTCPCTPLAFPASLFCKGMTN